MATPTERTTNEQERNDRTSNGQANDLPEVSSSDPRNQRNVHAVPYCAAWIQAKWRIPVVVRLQHYSGKDRRCRMSPVYYRVVSRMFDAPDGETRTFTARVYAMDYARTVAQDLNAPQVDPATRGFGTRFVATTAALYFGEDAMVRVDIVGGAE